MSIKVLFKDTIIYGVSTILMRLLSWILTPYYTNRLNGPVELGIIGELYAYVAFFNIIYMFGMETAYFRFVKDNDEKEVYNTAQNIIFFVSGSLTILLLLLATPIANAMHYEGKEIYIRLFAFILFFDNLVNISLAQLRQKGQSKKFVTLKTIYILCNVILNIIFVEFVIRGNFENIHKEDQVLWIVLANLIPSFLLFLYFSKSILISIKKYNKILLDQMLPYSYPLLIVGLAGMVNETLDRTLLKYLLPGKVEENLYQIGIYSANYKLSIIMSLAIQAFRMGAEPFFFKNADDKNAPKMYATIMNYFTVACCVIFVFTYLNLGWISKILNSKFSEGIIVVPILLLANMFLGMYYNTTIWYKYTNQTKKGGIIAVAGAIITIVLNIALIPEMGYLGSAVATLVCYFSMFIISLIWGNFYFPIPYNYFFLYTFISSCIIFSYFIRFIYQKEWFVTLFFSVLFPVVIIYYIYNQWKTNKNFIS
jgi:O-antigen/teichoic acid export membrane protein